MFVKIRFSNDLQTGFLFSIIMYKHKPGTYMSLNRFFVIKIVLILSKKHFNYYHYFNFTIRLIFKTKSTFITFKKGVSHIKENIEMKWTT